MITLSYLFLFAALHEVSARLQCYTCMVSQGVFYNDQGDIIPFCLKESCQSQCVSAVLEPVPGIKTEYRLCYSKIPHINAELPSYENVCNFVGSSEDVDCTRDDILFCDDEPLCNVKDMPTIMPYSSEPHPTTTENQKQKGLNVGLIAGGAIGGTVFLVLVGSVFGFLIRKHRSNDGRIAADEARIVTVLHPFDANEYVTMDEIEEMEQTIKNTQTEETSVKG
ncbi:hypothetical protein ACHWQZ_G018119 [Mnemiopsis leidyi]